jgi:predicted acetyltransferase
MYVHEISAYGTDFYRLDATGRWLPDIAEHWISNVTPPANLRGSRKDSDPMQPFQRAHVIAVKGVPAGFACVALQPFEYMPEDVDLIVSEFFLVHGHRGTGTARRALELMIERYPGRWYLGAIHDNLKAIHFWRKTLPSVGARDIRERPIDGDIVWEFSVRT